MADCCDADDRTLEAVSQLVGDEPARLSGAILVRAEEAKFAHDRALDVYRSDPRPTAISIRTRERQANVWFALVALRALQKACIIARDLTGSAEIRESLTWFNGQHPHIKPARDVLTYLPAHIPDAPAARGGRDRVDPEHVLFVTGDSIEVHVGKNAKVNVTKAIIDAEELATRVFRVLSGRPARHHSPSRSSAETSARIGCCIQS